MNWQERAEKAESELAKLAKQKPDLYMSFSDCGNFIRYWTRDTKNLEATMSVNDFEVLEFYAVPVPAPAAPEEWRKFVGYLAQQTTFPHPAVCICQACTWIKKARALLQSPAVNDSLTSQADCRACVNRGRVNGLSQETYCESCVHEGRNWRKNHFLDAAGQRLLEGGE